MLYHNTIIIYRSKYNIVHAEGSMTGLDGGFLPLPTPPPPLPSQSIREIDNSKVTQLKNNSKTIQ